MARLPARDPLNAPAGELRLEFEGIVQGVGFRPFVARLATELGLRGWVRNDPRGVQVRAAGSAEALRAFGERLLREAPPAARIVARRELPSAPDADWPAPPEQGFAILESATLSPTRPAAVTPDLALCADCRRELGTPGDRRHRYPFINCTNCGPRYSIVTALPYDRPRTTMAEFTMCPSCGGEYASRADRRFHAEPNACPVCGPQVSLLDRSGAMLAQRDAAIAAAAAELRRGRIVAVKGIGGFHLLCDAADDAVVEELRRRKRRDEKPFAVMFPSIEAVRTATELSDADAALLLAAAAPIVLLRRRQGAAVDRMSRAQGARAGRASPQHARAVAQGFSPRCESPERDERGLKPCATRRPGTGEESAIAAAVAPGNPLVGALLPYSPLHVLLLEAVGRPVVATSGNLAEEPLCFENDEAKRRLGGIADYFLIHNRAIARPVDDSVLRPAGGGAVVLRRARGFAPAPLALPPDATGSEPLLCVGGQMKNTIAVTAGANLVLSPHLGDLGNAASIAAFRRTVELLGALHTTKPARVVCDAHPDYASTRFAESLGLPVVRVQHHLAHILACLLEHGGGPRRVLGVAWDGTGYGGDGTVWGGEFIVVDRAARIASRVAHLRPFRLPGGEAAVREPRRSALGVLHELEREGAPAAEFDAFAAGASPGCRHVARASRPWTALRAANMGETPIPQHGQDARATSDASDNSEMHPFAAVSGFRTREAVVLRTMLARGTNAPVTTSVGRLFDAVAALLGGRSRCTFEGQAAMELEFLAASATTAIRPWPLPLVASGRGGTLQLDWAPMLADLLRRRQTEDRAELAARFHATLAAGILSAAKAVGLDTVALGGGCFQNVRLLEGTTRALEAAGFDVLRPRVLPPNDGGLAAGQALAAAWNISFTERLQ